MAAKFAEVDASALIELLEWCHDAIDFSDETDRVAAKAFRKITSDAGIQIELEI